MIIEFISFVFFFETFIEFSLSIIKCCLFGCLFDSFIYLFTWWTYDKFIRILTEEKIPIKSYYQSQKNNFIASHDRFHLVRWKCPLGSFYKLYVDKSNNTS